MPKHPPLVAPDGSPLPLPYRWLHACRVYALPPWSLIDTQTHALGLRSEFLCEIGSPPASEAVPDWIPFARHRQMDDFAGFVLRDGTPTGEVAIVHLTWAGRREQPGFPSIERYRDGWTWIERCMIPDTREWAELNGDDEIPDLLDEP